MLIFFLDAEKIGIYVRSGDRIELAFQQIELLEKLEAQLSVLCGEPVHHIAVFSAVASGS